MKEESRASRELIEKESKASRELIENESKASRDLTDRVITKLSDQHESMIQILTEIVRAKD
jgi:hypothetical protein